MNIELLNYELVRNNILNKIIYFNEIDSTNEYAKKNISHLDDRTIILTSNQTGGKGRFGRVWESSVNKNLTFSLVTFSDLRIDEIHFLNFYSSYIFFLTVSKFTSNSADTELRLKWPNDLLLNRKKIAGLLLDVKNLNNVIKKFIIGIGLNINETTFSKDIIDKATSLKKEFNREFIIEEILAEFITLFFGRISLLKCNEELMQLWNSASGIEGQKINFRQLEDDKELSGTVVKINRDGAILLNLENGRNCKFYSGEIRIIY